jgi:hypothetical protein
MIQLRPSDLDRPVDLVDAALRRLVDRSAFKMTEPSEAICTGRLGDNRRSERVANFPRQ